MNTARALLNAHSIKELTGIEPSPLKYHRNEGHIRGYRLQNGREWLYRLDQVNKLIDERLEKATRQNNTELAIISSSKLMEGKFMDMD